jgi:hypothetical protein
MPFERTYSILNCREFLLSLCDSKKTPRVPLAIRKEARRLLKHFPNKFDMENAVEGREVFGKVKV